MAVFYWGNSRQAMSYAHELGQTPGWWGTGRPMACRSPWSCKELDVTQRLTTTTKCFSHNPSDDKGTVCTVEWLLSRIRNEAKSYRRPLDCSLQEGRGIAEILSSIEEVSIGYGGKHLQLVLYTVSVSMTYLGQIAETGITRSECIDIFKTFSNVNMCLSEK